MAGAPVTPGAAVYADALFEAVEADGGVPGLEQGAAALEAVGEAWARDRTLRAYFLSAQLPRAERQKSLDRLAQPLPRLVGNFLRVLFERGRLPLLPEMATAFRTALDKRLRRVPVTLTTAVPVPETDFRAWVEMLRPAIDGEPVVKHEVRPEIIGGAVIRAGDRIADGSARRRLAELRTQLIRRGKVLHALQP
jgi:F-type H+-transporting ATPase subunit delta